MKHIIFLVSCLSLIIAEINFSGDARVRPRLDIKDYGPDKSSMDLYYLYRARLNVDASIGEGWFFNGKLGTNSPSEMTTMGSDNSKEIKAEVYDDNDEKIGYSDIHIKGDEPGNLNSYRPKVSFLNLY